MPTYLLIPHKNLEVKLKMFEGLEAYMVSAPFFLLLTMILTMMLINTISLFRYLGLIVYQLRQRF